MIPFNKACQTSFVLGMQRESGVHFNVSGVDRPTKVKEESGGVKADKRKDAHEVKITYSCDFGKDRHARDKEKRRKQDDSRRRTKGDLGRGKKLGCTAMFFMQQMAHWKDYWVIVRPCDLTHSDNCPGDKDDPLHNKMRAAHERLTEDCRRWMDEKLRENPLLTNDAILLMNLRRVMRNHGIEKADIHGNIKILSDRDLLLAPQDINNARNRLNEETYMHSKDELDSIMKAVAKDPGDFFIVQSPIAVNLPPKTATSPTSRSDPAPSLHQPMTPNPPVHGQIPKAPSLSIHSVLGVPIPTARRSLLQKSYRASNHHCGTSRLAALRHAPCPAAPGSTAAPPGLSAHPVSASASTSSPAQAASSSVASAPLPGDRSSPPGQAAWRHAPCPAAPGSTAAPPGLSAHPAPASASTSSPAQAASSSSPAAASAIPPGECSPPGGEAPLRHAPCPWSTGSVCGVALPVRGIEGSTATLSRLWDVQPTLAANGAGSHATDAPPEHAARDGAQPATTAPGATASAVAQATGSTPPTSKGVDPPAPLARQPPGGRRADKPKKKRQKAEEATTSDSYKDGGQPLIIGIMSQQQRDIARKYGHGRAVFLDSTFGMNKWGLSLFTLMVAVPGTGRAEVTGVPVAWVITSREDAMTTGQWLRALRQRIGMDIVPSCVMTDAAPELGMAVRGTFPSQVVHLLCMWHVFEKWKEHMATKIKDKDARDKVHEDLLKLQATNFYEPEHSGNVDAHFREV